MIKAVRAKLSILCLLSLAIGSIFTIKEAGWLQPFEWAIFDLFFQVRPAEPVDRRIVIVALEESDIKKVGYPVSDRTLANLLTKIKGQKPAVIGLDIYRDVPVIEGHAELVKVFKSTPNLIGIQKAGGDEPVAPPPVLKDLGQISTVDVVPDGDRKLRRVLLYPQVKGSEEIPNLGLALAYLYLGKQGITPQYGPNDFLQLKNSLFIRLEKDDGGYVNTDAGGYQMLINYRGSSRSFVTVSFSDVLSGKVSPNLMQDRIVLVGANAESVKDIFFTPYSQNLVTTPKFTSGVEINANIASSIIASVLDNRPLFKFLPEYVENLGILLLTSSAIVLIWSAKPDNYKRFTNVFTTKVILITFCYASGIVIICYVAFLNGFWLPVFLPVSQLIVSSLVLVGYIYLAQIKKTNIVLEQKNKELYKKQVELEEQNLQLEEKTLALDESQTNLILALNAAKTAIWDWKLEKDELQIIHNCSCLIGCDRDSISIKFKDFIETYVCQIDRELLVKKIDFIINDVLECRFNFRVDWETGTLHYLSVIGKVYYDSLTGKAIRMIGVLSDVTKMIENNKQLVQSVEFEKALLTNSFEIGMLLDEELQVCHVSPSIRRILGYIHHDVLGEKFTDLIHLEDVSLFDNSITRILLKPAATFCLKYRFRHQDGTWRMIESIVCNYLNEPGIKAFAVNSRDITEYQ